jgi:hypothetical protein
LRAVVTFSLPEGMSHPICIHIAKNAVAD